MHIIIDETPTSDLNAIKFGHQMSNGRGTFGEVQDITFENTDSYWELYLL